MKINRRKFISIFGLAGVGTAVNLDNVKALDLSINRFGNYKEVSLQNIYSIVITIKDGEIRAKNIDYSKDAELSIFGKIEDYDLGKLKSRTVNIDSPVTKLDSEMIEINNPDLFSRDKYDPNKEILNIYLTFKLNHPSIETEIVEEKIYKLDIGALGQLELHSHKNATNFNTPSDKSLSNTETISGSTLDVLKNKTGFKQVKELISGGSVINRSDYSVSSGVIDTDRTQHTYSSTRNYRNISNDKETNAETISGSTLDVLKNKTGFKQVKELISGGSVINRSDYSISSGVIDTDRTQHTYSSTRNYRNISNDKETNAESFK